MARTCLIASGQCRSTRTPLTGRPNWRSDRYTRIFAGALDIRPFDRLDFSLASDPWPGVCGHWRECRQPAGRGRSRPPDTGPYRAPDSALTRSGRVTCGRYQVPPLPHSAGYRVLECPHQSASTACSGVGPDDADRHIPNCSTQSTISVACVVGLFGSAHRGCAPAPVRPCAMVVRWYRHGRLRNLLAFLWREVPARCSLVV